MNEKNAVEIGLNTFWIGDRPEGELLFSNPYLRRFEDEEAGEFSLLIDPSASKDFEVVLSKIREVLGEVGRVDGIFNSHQDPDISASTARILREYNSKAVVMASGETGELLHNYHEPEEDQILDLELYPRGLQLPRAGRILPIALRFGHHRGAMMVFDPESGVLFSGDLFSGLTDPASPRLYATEEDWVGIRAFHQVFIPTSRVIREGIALVRGLKEKVKVIAPQHGRLLRGEVLHAILERLEELPVGIDLTQPDAENEATRWQEMGVAVLKSVISIPEELHQRGLIEADEESGFRVVSATREGVEELIWATVKGLGWKEANELKFRVAEMSHRWDLPMPRVGFDETRIKGGFDQAEGTDLFGHAGS